MDFDKAESIFWEALEYSDLSQREKFLSISCGDDQVLMEKVTSMITDLEKADELFSVYSDNLELPREIADSVVCELSSNITIGDRIDEYILIRKLGEGAFGVVFEAKQTHPIKRNVAIKILKKGTDSQTILRRFEVESQILVQINNPHVASLYDAGITPSGQPYFVMELVRGISITKYCASKSIDLKSRLELVRQVCIAVQYAHDKGVIHRDLKPSNILVSDVDGKLGLKIIDFGIAKLIDSTFEKDVVSLYPNQLIGTPSYMSPEQICGKMMGTKSDVYSIGVLLYELLTGHPPFNNQELLNLGVDAMRLRILEEKPPLPSALIERVFGGVITRASRELDWIINRAMAKDADLRYRSAMELGDDIHRFLSGYAINAHPPSVLYNSKKWMRRNKLLSFTFFFALSSLIAGLSISTVLYFRAKEAEQNQLALRLKAEEREHIAKAAILIYQDKYKEANMEIDKMSSPLSEPSLEATNVFKTLKIWSGMNGDWETSSKRVMELSKVYRFDENDTSDNSTRDLVSIGATLVKVKNFETYYSFCDDIVGKLEKTRNPVAAEQILKLCTFIPSENEVHSRLKPIVELAEYSMLKIDTGPSDWLESWRCAAIGVWCYRDGDYIKARFWSKRSLLFKDDSLSRVAYAKCILSMSLWELGETEKARNVLEEAKKLVYSHVKIPFKYNNEGIWFEWLYDEILLNEAIQKQS
ncbi:MAG: serine/threonine protein kinase [Opitutales bacterium]|nr:serine/threonine protein kinase [Opitutales bacterium]